jgi:hypothetical protein
MHRADPEQQTRNAKDLCARGPGHGYAVSSMQGLLNNVCKVLKHKGYIDTEQ